MNSRQRRKAARHRAPAVSAGLASTATIATLAPSHNHASPPPGNSYGQILKSSSIMGGVAGINLLLGMVRTKFAALLIGTIGVGLIANFSAIQGFIGTLAGMGIQSSAVRDIASAHAAGDTAAMGRTVLSLRRICWLTGLLGAGAMAGLSPWLSQWTFGNTDYTPDIAALGLIILCANLQGGQMALIQGTRRIGDLAKLQLYGAITGTGVTLGFYYWLGLRGIVPALLSLAILQLLFSWGFARRVPVPTVHMTWRASFRAAGGMVRLGLAMMWTGLLGSAVAYATNTLITQRLGLPAVGLYSAAFSLSGIFVNFVLNAMAADYYPRLAGMAYDKTAMNRLVNEQTEIGLLLAVPGLLATLTLAPWIIRMFYTPAFLPAVELLQCFVLGCLWRVISWPLGFVMLALNRGGWFFLTETAFQLIYLGLMAGGLLTYGLPGIAMSFLANYVLYTLAVGAVARQLTGFAWSSSSRWLWLILLPLIAINFVVVRSLTLWPATAAGSVVTGLAAILSLRGLIQRLGQQHRIVRMALRIPCAHRLCGEKIQMVPF